MSFSIIGHAIVSADGMIADRHHHMPAALRNDVDWRRFQAELDRAAVVVLGRIGHEAHPNPGRKRLVVTSRVAWLERDPADENTMLWNPTGIGFTRVLAGLGLTEGMIAVTGGTRVFDLFLPRFTQFDLVEVAGVTIPDGMPCFTGGRPAEVLTEAGLIATQPEPLDPGIDLTVWTRS